DFLARDLSALDSRSAGWSHVCVCSQSRRLPRAAVAWRPEWHHDLEHRRHVVRGGLSMAAGCSDFLLHAGAGARVTCDFTKARKGMELLVSGNLATVRGSHWLTVHALAVFAFLYLPIVVLIVYSFNGEGVGGFPPRNLTLNWYRILVQDGPLWDSVTNS